MGGVEGQELQGYRVEGNEAGEELRIRVGLPWRLISPRVAEKGGTMSYLEILGLLVTGAGTLGSILGVFFAIYASRNGRITREFIKTQNKDMWEFIAAQNREMREFISAQSKDTKELIVAQNKDMREFIASENKDMREFLAEVLERLGNRISQEEEKTREEIRRLRHLSG